MSRRPSGNRGLSPGKRLSRSLSPAPTGRYRSEVASTSAVEIATDRRASQPQFGLHTTALTSTPSNADTPQHTDPAVSGSSDRNSSNLGPASATGNSGPLFQITNVPEKRRRDKLWASVVGCFRGSPPSSPDPYEPEAEERPSSVQHLRIPSPRLPSLPSEQSDSAPQVPLPSCSRDLGGANDALHSPTPESYGLFTFGAKRLSSEYNIDIVAVHGLGGHWERTWTDEDKLWLRDFLPSQLPSARIMSYGYDSKTAFSKAITDITGAAEMLLDRLNGERQEGTTKPIIFISHSLGGIVVKKALILAHERSRVYGRLLTSVRGVVFFGVPHRGADIAYWATFAANIVKITGFSTNTNFIDALKKNSETFTNISQQSIERVAPLMIRTFFETETLYNLLIVDKDSACLGLPNEIPVGIAGANHRTMCKFSDINSQKYSQVWRAIKMMSDSITAPSTTLPAAMPTAAIPPVATPPATTPLSKEEKQCLQSLYTSDYNSHLERVPQAVQGTCTWFLRHTRYLTWKEAKESSLLWVSADPGCGKSVLSSFLVGKLQGAELQAEFPGTDLPATLCFFFFKDDNDEQKSATFALCAVLHQLFTAKNSLIRYAMEEFEAKGRKFTEEFYTLWKIFTRAVADPESDCGNVICVIDALDECEESTRKTLINSLVKFYSGHWNPSASNNPNTGKNHLKIILTSRPYQSIEHGFHDLPRIRLRGEDETNAVSEDVGLVIGARIRRLGSRWNLPDKVQTNLQDSLVKGADRTFLWVSLILGILEETPEACEREFNEILTNIPPDLDAVYEKILGNSRDHTKAKKILHIIVAAIRPLTLDEMNIALAIEPSHESSQDLEPNILSSIASTVKELCGLFVRVIDSKIYLVHQTAKEFLINDSTNGPSPGAWKHALCPVQSDFVMATVCICYLRFTNFKKNPLVIRPGRRTIQEDVDIYTRNHAFLDYAAKHWAVHTQKAQSEGSEANLLQPALELMDCSSKRFLTWFQVYWTTVDNQSNCPQTLTDLMVASYFGNEAVVQQLLEGGANINKYVDGHGGALNMAVFGKQRGTTQLLLSMGASLYLNKKEYTDLQKKASNEL